MFSQPGALRSGTPRSRVEIALAQISGPGHSAAGRRRHECPAGSARRRRRSPSLPRTALGGKLPTQHLGNRGSSERFGRPDDSRLAACRLRSARRGSRAPVVSFGGDHREAVEVVVGVFKAAYRAVGVELAAWRPRPARPFPADVPPNIFVAPAAARLRRCRARFSRALARRLRIGLWSSCSLVPDG